MHSFDQSLSFDSIHEASHVILGAYVGAANIHVILGFGQPRTNFAHYLALPGLVASYAGYAGDMLLSKLAQTDCVVRSTTDGVLRQLILRKVANPVHGAAFCAEAERRAFQLVERFKDEIYEAVSVIQRHMEQRLSAPADVIDQLECAIRVRALGKAEGETDARREAEQRAGCGDTIERPLRRGEMRPLFPVSKLARFT